MKNTKASIIIFSFLISIVSTRAETIVGELPGEFTVNNLGAAGYTVPLSVSPGTAGVEPKLSISYSSQGGNGALGVGFALSGLSTITRVSTSLAQDGFIDGVDFDDNDRFAMDGQRLMLVSTNGVYGDANTEYHTEIDTFSRVVANGQSGNGPEWFKVWAKSGLIYEYGNTTDSAFKPTLSTGSGQATNTVMSWAVNRVSDTLGNYMTFTYDETSSGLQISEIDYTGNVGASLNPYNSVEFVYTNRPDPSFRFFRGVRMDQTNRLQKIVMKHDGTYIHDYRFGYTTNEAGQSVVDSLQQVFGERAGADCLPETKLEFSGSSSATNFSSTVDLDVSVGNNSVLGDFNGDGLSDIVSYNQLGLSNGDGTFDVSTLPSGLSWSQDSGGLLSGDFNGDGQTDLCAFGADEEDRRSGLSNGDGTFTVTNGYDFLPSNLTFYVEYDHATALVADFNGDGLSDICSVGDLESSRWIGLSNGDGTFSFTEGYNAFPSNNTARTDTSFVLTGDFNGDGLSDLCSVGSTELSRWTGLSNDDGTFTFTNHYDVLPSDLTIAPAVADFGVGNFALTGDFNGDGLTDICGMGTSEACRWVGLSNGDGTFEFTKGTNALPSDLDTYSGVGGCYLRTGDFNGDGLSDLCSVGLDEDTRWVGLSKGDGSFLFTKKYNVLPSHLVTRSDSDGGRQRIFYGEGF